jgi:transcriptional regulator with XRE-family HTH domain
VDTLAAMKHPKFAERFNKAVALSGVESTQKALGKLLGVSEVMIWSYRNGEKLPRMAMALNMAEEFGVSIDWLLQGTGEPINLATTEKSAKHKVKPLRKSTQAIVDLVEQFTEAERKKAHKILSLTFLGK